MFYKILVPLDGSELAEVTLWYAEGLAGRMRSAITLLIVLSPEDLKSRYMYDCYIEELAKRTKANAEERGAGKKEGEIKVDYEILKGDAAEEIVDYADKARINLIIMSTQGRSGVRRWTLGNVANKVLRATGKPVLLIRAKGAKPDVYRDCLVKVLVPVDGSKESESSLDLGYEADKSAFRQITRIHSKEVMECFTTYDTKQEFFKLATDVDPNDAYIHQHKAMMALREKKTGDALDYIGVASKLHPQDFTIRDTHARILTARGIEQPWITARTAFAEAENILNANISRRPTDPYGYLSLAELDQALAQKSDNAEERASYLSKAYEIVLRGIERCRIKTMLWQLQGQLELAVGTLEGARDAFRKALVERPSNVITRLLFAKLEENEGQVPVALDLLRDGLSLSGNDQRLRHRLGVMLWKYQPSQTTEIVTHLKAAVMIPGNDYIPRFDLACFLFQIDDYPGAYQNFEVLSEIDMPRSEAYQVHRIIRDETGDPKYFPGQIANLTYDYGFIKSETPRNIYFNRRSIPTEVRNQIKLGINVRFQIGFNVRGPVAINVQAV